MNSAESVKRPNCLLSSSKDSESIAIGLSTNCITHNVAKKLLNFIIVNARSVSGKILPPLTLPPDAKLSLYC